MFSPCKKFLHTSLNIALSGCNPSNIMSSFTHSPQVFLPLPRTFHLSHHHISTGRHRIIHTPTLQNSKPPPSVCSGSVVVTAYDSESGRPGSDPEWGLIYYEASITAQGLPEPSSLRGSTLGTRAAEHKGCNWGMQIDLWLQPCAVFGHSFSGISWHMPQKWSQFNCMTLSKGSAKR